MCELEAESRCRIDVYSSIVLKLEGTTTNLMSDGKKGVQLESGLQRNVDDPTLKWCQWV